MARRLTQRWTYRNPTTSRDSSLEWLRTVVPLMARSVRPLLFIVPFSMLVLSIVVRLGFVPLDEGFITSQSLRLLRGEVPHAAFVSPRPVFSGVLHIVDVLLPTPLFLTSRVIAAMQVVTYTVALAGVCLRLPLARWTPVWTLAVSAAVFVNIGLFPLMAWHTIDGLMLSALGFVIVGRPRSVGWLAAGLVLLGAAAMTKQSFAPALLIGLWLAVRSDVFNRTLTHWGLPRRVAFVFAAGMAIPVAYLLWVSLAGGLSDAFDQLTGGSAPVGQSLVNVMRADSWSIGFVAGCIGLRIISMDRIRLLSTTPVVAVAARWITTAIVVTLAAQAMIASDSLPATMLFWLALAAALLPSTAGRFDVDGLLTVLLGWMASLSWGAASPALVAGSLSLLLLHRTWRDRNATLPVNGRVFSSLAFVVLILFAGGFVLNRRASPYFDRPVSELGTHLGSVDPALWGIWTNSTTGEYVVQIRECIDARPAGRVAVLPDNVGLYSAFDLENPFPVDWAYSKELVADARDRMLKRAAELSIEGDFLVLFQTTSTFGLSTISLPASVSSNDPAWFWDDSGLMEDIRVSLGGERFSCGSFVGNYAPG